MLKKFGEAFMAMAGLSTPRRLEGVYEKIYTVIAISFSLLFLYVAGPPFLGHVPMHWNRGLYIMLISIMVFMKYPFRSKSPMNRVTILDGVMILASIAAFGYWILYFNDLILRPGMFTKVDTYFALLAVIISLEVSRRVLGVLFPSIGILVILYSIYGNAQWIPLVMRSRGFTWSYIVSYCYLSDGIFGFILSTVSTFVTLFVIFGGLMEALGAGEFFINLPYAITCGLRGGPAKTAVLASCLFGSISGSATANTAATGSFTIPLMIKTGYKREVAGAIEPAASTGGMFMPPVMGAGAFIMANMLGISYSDIVKVALAPAIIYFTSVYMIVHYYAKAHNIPVVPKEERPNVWAILKESFYYMIPLIMLLYMLMTYVSAQRSIYWVILTMIAITLLARLIKKRESSAADTCKEFGQDLLKGFKAGADGSLTIGAVVGTTGIVVGGVMLTGIGFSFTTAVMAVAGDRLIIAILMAFIAAYILGMGLTVTAAYILCAVLAVPALVKLGVNPLAAHMLVFWFSQTSNISPPVCLAAFVGAGIAKSHPYKTGFNALMFSVYLLVMPLLFVYSEILMPNGLTMNAVAAMVSSFVGTIAYAAAINGYYHSKLNIVLRLVMLAAGIFLVIPGSYTDVIGYIIMIVIYVWQRLQERRVRVQPA
jgi:TRAP transporter 4TM/12TM fusion protein